MKSEISEIKRTVAPACTGDVTTSRTWSSGQRTSRTDAPMVGTLSVDSVDAVFEEESLSFVKDASLMQEAASSQAEPTGMVESLASQLAVLESQCVNLRRMLEMAATGAR